MEGRPAAGSRALTVRLCEFVNRYSLVELLGEELREAANAAIDKEFTEFLQTKSRPMGQNQRPIPGAEEHPLLNNLCFVLFKSPDEAQFIMNPLVTSVPPLVSLLSIAASMTPNGVVSMLTAGTERNFNVTLYGVLHTVKVMVGLGANCRPVGLIQAEGFSCMDPLWGAMHFLLWHPKCIAIPQESLQRLEIPRPSTRPRSTAPIMALIDLLLGLSQPEFPEFYAIHPIRALNVPGARASLLTDSDPSGTDCLSYLLRVSVPIMHYIPKHCVKLLCGLLLRGHKVDPLHVTAVSSIMDYLQFNPWERREARLIADLLRSKLIVLHEVLSACTQDTGRKLIPPTYRLILKNISSRQPTSFVERARLITRAPIQSPVRILKTGLLKKSLEAEKVNLSDLRVFPGHFSTVLRMFMPGRDLYVGITEERFLDMWDMDLFTETEPQ